jgi:hypothetical protein
MRRIINPGMNLSLAAKHPRPPSDATLSNYDDDEIFCNIIILK